MGSDTKIIIGAVALGAVALYLFKDKIGKPIDAVGDVTAGIASPFSYAEVAGKQAEENLIQRETIYREGLGQPETKQTIFDYAYNTEKTKTLQTEKILSTQEARTQSTQVANKLNLPEMTQRKASYGSTPTEYLQKMFMPTPAVAAQRREAVITPIKSGYAKVDKFFGGILPGGKKLTLPKITKKK